ncbi:hypothetical protein [Phytoactinopolyspora alkaliphila]|nr:hypothetical protein [Phytoactinopolyspora alkaliphila]
MEATRPAAAEPPTVAAGRALLRLAESYAENSWRTALLPRRVGRR